MAAARAISQEQRRRIREDDIVWKVGTPDANTEVDNEVKEELMRKASQTHVRIASELERKRRLAELQLEEAERRQAAQEEAQRVAEEERERRVTVRSARAHPSKAHLSLLLCGSVCGVCV